MEARHTIGLVGLDQELADGLSNRLESWNLSIHRVKKCAELTGRLMGTSPRVLLVQIDPHGNEGLEIISRLDEMYPSSERIVLIDGTEPDYLIKCVDLGVFSIIPPPFDMRRISHAIGRALEKVESRISLVESERRFRTLYENLPLALYRTSADEGGRVLMANSGMAEMFGYGSIEKLKQVRVVDLYWDPVDREDSMNSPDNFAFERLRLKKKNGELFWGEVTGRIIRDEKGEKAYFDGMIRDVTELVNIEEELEEYRRNLEDLVKQRTEKLEREIVERVKAEQELRESREILARAQEIAQVGSWKYDYRLRQMDWSDEVYRILGQDRQSFPMTREAIMETIHPDDRESVIHDYTDALENDAPYDNIHRSIRPSGEIRIIRELCEIERDEDGQPVRAIGTVHDITEALEAEEALRRSEERVRQVQKMEAIGTLAGGIAHDFNNILFAILGNADLSLDLIEEEGLLKDNVRDILSAAKRGSELVRQILTFSRRTERVQGPVEVAPILKETIKLLRATLPATIDIRLDDEAEDSTIQGDPTEVHQVLMNLCANAGQAMLKTGGELYVSLSERQPDETEASELRMDPDSDCLVLSVCDSGPGIPQDVLEKIFEPFFTTKEIGRGTGMGLAVVHGIVTRMGGGILVSSEIGRGAEFHVFLPRSGTTETFKPQELETVLRTGTERIMVVDDEEAITRLMTHLLGGLGYKVTTFQDPLEALRALGRNIDAIDLLITDQTMPGLTGGELAIEALRMRPELPIVIATGFSETLTEDQALELGVRAYLAKPVSRADLLRVMNDIFGSGPVPE